MKAYNENIAEFMSYSQNIASIISQYLSESSNFEVCINNSWKCAESLILSKAHTTQSTLSIEEVLQRIIKRWEYEIAYENEIMALKNTVCQVYEGFCSGKLSQQFVIFVRDQRQKVIDTIFELTKIEQKQKAQIFCNNIVHGFENEALSNFVKIVHYVLWEFLLTPYPVDLIHILSERTKQLGETLDESKITDLTEMILKHLKEYLNATRLKSDDFEDVNLFRDQLQSILTMRKTCFITITENITNILPIIHEYKPKCIEWVDILCQLPQLQNESLLINYDSISLSDNIYKDGLIDLFNFIPKGIKIFKFQLRNVDESDFDIIQMNFSRLIYLTELNLEISHDSMSVSKMNILGNALCSLPSLNKLYLTFLYDNITDKEVEALLNSIKKMNKIYHLYIDLSQNSVSDVGIECISKTFEELKNLTFLELHAIDEKNPAPISSKGMKILANNLTQCKALTHLALNFSWNPLVGDSGLEAICSILYSMKMLTFLELSFINDQITDHGIILLSNAIQHMHTLTHLSLGFRYTQTHINNKAFRNNLITDKSIINLGKSLRHFEQMAWLMLNFSYNEVTDDGIQTIAEALHMLNKITSLQLYYHRNKVTDDGFKKIAASLEYMSELEYLGINFSHNIVTDNGVEALAHALDNKSKLRELELFLISGYNKADGKGATLINEMKQKNKNLSLNFRF